MHRDFAAAAWFDDEPRFVAALRAGEEAAFAALLDRYHPSLVNVALAYVPNRAVAEEVAQETWLAVLQGIDRFEARSSLKTWIFSILLNRARRRGQREGRIIPFSALAQRDWLMLGATLTVLAILIALTLRDSVSHR